MFISRHFTFGELTHTDTGLPNVPEVPQGANLVRLAEKLLEPIRTLLGQPMMIHSGFRCAAVNSRVGGAKNSAHLEGRAADFHAGNMPCREAFDRIRSSGLPYDKLILEEHGGRYWIHIQIERPGDIPRQKTYIASVTDTGTAYREVHRGEI